MSESAAREHRKSATPGVRSVTRTEFSGLSAAESIERSINQIHEEVSALLSVIDERIEDHKSKYVEGKKVSDVNQALEAVMERDADFVASIGSPNTEDDPYSLQSEEDLKGISQVNRIKLAKVKIAEIASRYEKGKSAEAGMQKLAREILPSIKKEIKKKEAITEGHEKRALKIINDMLKIHKDLSSVEALEADAWGAAIRELQHHYEFKSYDDEEETEE